VKFITEKPAMKKIQIIFVGLLFLAINAQATIRYVTQNGAGTQDGSSWANEGNIFVVSNSGAAKSC
jgi:hypothetical protein